MRNGGLNVLRPKRARSRPWSASTCSHIRPHMRRTTRDPNATPLGPMRAMSANAKSDSDPPLS